MENKDKKTLWNLLDDLEGDKVVWMIVLMLILISVLCIFSSTSRLLVGNQTRMDMVKNQLSMVAIGFALIFLCYKLPSIDMIRVLSMLGYPLSLLLLVLLTARVNNGFIKTPCLNSAYRVLQFKEFQIHVFEVVKVSMVMYLSWAVAWLKDHDGMRNLKKKALLLYLPFVSVFVMVLLGSNSSGLFIGLIMFLTIVIGGGDYKDMMLLGSGGLAVLGLCLGIYFISGGTVMQRFETLLSRLDESVDYEQVYLNPDSGPREKQKALDLIRQPYGARIAIHEGGLFGKGPGQSTQRYVVPAMSEDYMYSFIVEEYGLAGGIIIIILYVSLLARGAIIVRNCGKDIFAKSAVAGLSLLITGQAFLHMFVNVDIGPMTGQTLPLISHGNSAFLCFCLAFGIILSISKLAERRIERETRKAEPLMDYTDEVRSGLDELDEFESND